MVFHLFNFSKEKWKYLDFMEKLFVENLNNPLSFPLPWKVFLWGTYCDWRFGSFLDCQPLLILANWNPCSTWFHFHFSGRRWLECGFHSAPSCILIAFAYCTDHKCIKPGQNSQLMLQHVCTHICPHTYTHPPARHGHCLLFIYCAFN